MNEMVKSQPDGSTREKAQEAIRVLLDGNPPNGTQPEECGEYRGIVSALYDAYSDGGTDSVSRLAMDMYYANDQLVELMAGDEAVEDDESEEVGLADKSDPLPSGVKVYTWAEKEHEFGPIQWCWPGWIPSGLLSLIVGSSGCGKSLFLLSGVCSSLITGADFPDGTPYEGPIGKVLWLETEEALALNLERVRSLGLPLDSFLSIEMEDGLSVGLENKTHREAIRQVAMRPDVVGIAVDSLSAGHGTDENSTEMLRITGWLALLAKVTGKPVISTHHLNKSMLMPGDPVRREHVRGSTSILQLARVVVGINYASAENAELRRLNIVKANVKTADTFVYAVDGNGKLVPSDLDGADSVSAGATAATTAVPSGPDRWQEMADLLTGMVADGEKPAREVAIAVSKAGLSFDKAKRFKKALGIESFKKGDGWYWRKIQDQ